MVFDRTRNMLLDLLNMTWYKSKHLISNYFKSHYRNRVVVGIGSSMDPLKYLGLAHFHVITI